MGRARNRPGMRMSATSVIARIRAREHEKIDHEMDNIDQLDVDALDLCEQYEVLESKSKRLVEELRVALGRHDV